MADPLDHPDPTPETADANRRAFDAWRDDFFAHYHVRRPVNATFIGIHTHDHDLPDFTPDGRAQTLAEMRDLRARLAALPIDGLTEAQWHDRLLIDGCLEIQTWEDAAPQFHAGNPAVYTGEGVFAVLSLFLRDSEPLAERVAAAVSRMRSLPAFLAQARTNVPAAPSAWTARAAREARAGVAYFGDGLRILAAERGIADPAFLAAAGVARDAFAAHAAWLDQELASRLTNDVACGREAFDRYLARGHCLPPEQDAAWVDRYARTAFQRHRETLAARARDIDPARTPDELLADLADLHPSEDGYYAAYRSVWEAARHAALDHNLLTWPDHPIDYVPFPRSDREAAPGLYYLFYRCPPPFGRPETHRYLVTPIDPEMPPAERERRLRATNDSVIKLNHVVHHGGIGHHLQNWHAFRAASRIGQVAGVDCASRIALFCGGTLVEGWACYATDLMDDIGFLTPLESLAHQQGRLRMAARAIVDAALHTGSMSLAETAAFYEREVGMPPPAAEAEAVKNAMFPGAAMMYLIGTDAIHDLRHHIAAREGAAFSLPSFHDRFLSYGAIPVSLIASAMLSPEPVGV